MCYVMGVKMIVDKIENLYLYKAYLPDSDELVRYFKSKPAMGEKKEVVKGSYVFTPFVFASEASENKRWEIHRNHFDIHVAINKKECIEWIPVGKLSNPIEYNKEVDVEFFADPAVGSKIILEEGYFALVTPSDAHKPSVLADGVNGGVKAVIKANAKFLP